MTRKKTLLALCMGLLVGAYITGAPVAAYANDEHDEHDKDHKKGTHVTQEHDDHDHDKKDEKHDKSGH
jgi:hypothetical protein